MNDEVNTYRTLYQVYACHFAHGYQYFSRFNISTKEDLDLVIWNLIEENINMANM